MHAISLRTDLAMEAQEALRCTPHEAEGIQVDETTVGTHLQKTTVRVLTENAARRLGKPKGTYVTLESPKFTEAEDDFHSHASEVLASCLLSFCPVTPNKSVPETVLVVGLGNRNVTPDCLGPFCVDHLAISRHLFTEFGAAAFTSPLPYLLCGIVPGVMGQTGMETTEILRGIVHSLKPSVCIVVDSLAARSIKRLNRTIQISDSGIWPGSGVGNHRKAITAESLGIPVLSVGVPTVVDAATIVTDSLHLIEKEAAPALPPTLHSLFVTPKDIDDTVYRLAFTLSEGINKAFGPTW